MLRNGTLVVLLATSLFNLPLPLSIRGKALTQYTPSVWTQEQGLPQDAVRCYQHKRLTDISGSAPMKVLRDSMATNSAFVESRRWRSTCP